MKKNVAIISLLLIKMLQGLDCAAQSCDAGSCSNFGIQYPSITFSTTSSTWTLLTNTSGVTASINAGNWTLFNVTQGHIYEWTYCSSYGNAYQNWDAQLTLYNTSNQALCFQDNSGLGTCPNAPYLRYIAQFTGVVKLLTSAATTANCQSNSGMPYSAMAWRQAGICSAVTNGTTQPQDQTASVGGSATFNVSVTGSSPYSYFWYKNNVVVQTTVNSSSSTSSYTTPALSVADDGNTYYCLIVNCNSSYQAQSSTAALTVNQTCTTPTSPSGLNATAVSTSEIDLNWNDNSNNETGFNIERSTSSSGPFNSIATVSANITSYDNTIGLQPSTQYFYRIRAYNGSTSCSSSYTADNATTQAENPNNYNISGTVTNNGNGLSGVSLTASPGNYSASTTGSGTYSLSVPSGWTGTVTPGLINYSFSPPNIPYNNVTSNQPGQNYTATNSSTPTVISLIGTNVIPNHAGIQQNATFYSTNTPYSNNDPIKVCADGSTATYFKVNVSNTAGVSFRILDENQNIVVTEQTSTNIDKYGKLGTHSPIGSNELEVAYTHPQYMDYAAVSRPCTLEILYNDNPINGVSFPLNIHRAPVLFVHGVWGDGSTFSELASDLTTITSTVPFQHYPEKSGFIANGINTYDYPLFKLVDYYVTNGASFKSNRQVVATNINYLLSNARIHNYSCGKVIVVAHSMGGILTRLYLNSTWANSILYRNDIQKIITLNTPHYGSQIASMGLHIKNSYGPVVWGFYGLGSLFNFGPGDFNGIDAIKDLSVSSTEVTQYLNGPNSQPNIVPHHEITTSKVFAASDDQKETILNNWINSCGNPFPALHDEVVDIRSQRSDLTNTTWPNTNSNQFHIGSSRNTDVKQEVIQLIDKNENSSFFSNEPYKVGSIQVPVFSCNLFSNRPGAHDSIKITRPLRSDNFMVGDSVTFKFIGTSGINRVYVIAGVNDSTLYSNDTTFIDSLTITTKLKGSNCGKIYVGAIGYNVQTLIAYDSSSFYLSPASAIDSFYIDKETIVINKGQYEHVKFDALFSDGISRNLNSYNLDINNYDTAKIQYAGNGFFYGKEVCDTVVIVSFQNKLVSLRIIVTDIPGNNLASFNSDKNSICKGGSINFKNSSLGLVSGLHWEFPGGIPNSSTLPDPVITYDSAGVYRVTLVTTFSNGTDTLSIDSLVEVKTSNKTISSGNWDSPSTWGCGTIPSMNDSAIIAAGHNVSLNTSVQVRKLYIENNGSLIADDPAVTLTVGSDLDKTGNVICNGAINIAKGNLIIKGNLKTTNGSTFNMSGGKLIIDGNSGQDATSIKNGQHLFNISPASNNFSFTGGILQFINPPVGANSQTINCRYNFGPSSTVMLGDGISTTAGSNPNGFGGDMMPARIGKLVLNAATDGNNRAFKIVNPLTIVKDCELVSGNLIQSAPLNVVDSLPQNTATDYDGNSYPVIRICNQVWMEKNLEVTHYRNGDTIPQVQDSATWVSLTTGAWRYYQSNTANGPIYGKLYNWYAVNDPRNIAPEGWHIPNNSEWSNLTDTCLTDPSIAGGKMKTIGTIQAETGLWQIDNNTSTNSSGFSAVPGGYALSNGTYGNLGIAAFWWSATQNGANAAWLKEVDISSEYIYGISNNKKAGASVRCIRD